MCDAPKYELFSPIEISVLETFCYRGRIFARLPRSQRRRYPRSVSGEEWEFAALYLMAVNTSAPQRKRAKCGRFSIHYAGSHKPWRVLLNDFPPQKLERQLT
jgi:hypothetical protein